jgi:hypothetical protein
MKTAKRYPARFVGEFTRAEWKNEDCPTIGDVALITECPDGRPRVAIRCGCGDVDVVPSDAEGWNLTSRDPVHLHHSVLVTAGDRTRCHYVVHDGKLTMLEDTTVPLL